MQHEATQPPVKEAKRDNVFLNVLVYTGFLSISVFGAPAAKEKLHIRWKEPVSDWVRGSAGAWGQAKEALLGLIDPKQWRSNAVFYSLALAGGVLASTWQVWSYRKHDRDHACALPEMPTDAVSPALATDTAPVSHTHQQHGVTHITHHGQVAQEATQQISA